MFEFLLNSGPVPNILKDIDKTICGSIFMPIVWWGDISFINTLLSHKVDVNFAYPNGNNALQTDQERKNTDI